MFLPNKPKHSYTFIYLSFVYCLRSLHWNDKRDEFVSVAKLDASRFIVYPLKRSNIELISMYINKFSNNKTHMLVFLNEQWIALLLTVESRRWLSMVERQDDRLACVCCCRRLLWSRCTKCVCGIYTMLLSKNIARMDTILCFIVAA